MADRLELAAAFNEKHGLELLEQTLKIQEEAGEVAEAALWWDGRLLFKDGEFDIGDELAQLIVTAYYVAELAGVDDIDRRVDGQLEANLDR